MPAVSNDRKILLVTNDLGPRSGGIETFILGLLEKLDGSEIAIYTSAQPGDQAFDLKLREKFGVVIYRDRSKVLLPSPRVIRSIKRVMRIHKSQTIWFGAAAPLAFMAPNLRKAGAKRIIALTHGHEVWWAKLPIFNLALRRIGNSVDVITYLGDFTRRGISKAIGQKAELIQLAPGISTDFFTPGTKSQTLLNKYQIQDRPTLVCVGRLVHRKGQDKLIEAMPAIRRAVPNALLLIIGTGPREKYLRNLVAKLKLDDAVKLLGRITYDQLPEHIRLGDVFVGPSRSRLFGLEVEGLGIVYLEASSCGLPVIAGDSGGAPDAVQSEKTGLIVDGTDPAQIASACIKLLENPELAINYGKNGRTWALSDWNWDLWGSKFAQILKG